MKLRFLTTVLSAAAIGTACGCASTSDHALSFFGQDKTASADSAQPAGKPVSGTASSRRKDKDEERQLSPEFQAARKTFRNTEKTMLAWARYQEDIGEYAEARKKYRELQIAYPENVEAQLGLARIEMQTGRSQQSEQLLTDLAKKYPEDVNIRLEQGRLYTHLQDWDRAVRAFEEACQLDPDNQNSHYELGLALARSRQFDQALSHLTFAVGEPAANYNIGYILYEQGSDREAVEWFRNAMLRHPDHQTAERSRAMLAKLIPDSPQAGRNAVAGSRNSATERSAADTGNARNEAFQTVVAPGSGSSATQSTVPAVTGRQTAAFSSQPSAASERVMPAQHTPGNLLPPVISTSPFRHVSNTNVTGIESTAPGNNNHLSGEPPQWNGPSPRPLPPVQSPVGTSGELPLWRARQTVSP